MTIENSGESPELSLEHIVATEVMELRNLMVADQRRIGRMEKKSMELRAQKLARTHDSLNSRTILQLMQMERKQIKPPRSIRTPEFFVRQEKLGDSESYYAELKPTMKVARLSIIHSTDIEPDSFYRIVVDPAKQPVMAEVIEMDDDQERRLHGDELYAPLGFLAAAKALYPSGQSAPKVVE